MKRLSALFAAVCIFIPTSCSVKKENNQFLAGIDKTGSIELQYADQFSVDTYEGGYSLITIGSDKYLLVPEGADIPENTGGATIINQPVDNIYLAASSAMDLFDGIECLDSISMTSTDSKDWSLPAAARAIDSGKMTYIGKYNMPDYEALVEGDCKLAIESNMIYHSPETREKIEQLGIPVLVESSSYESHPLGHNYESTYMPASCTEYGRTVFTCQVCGSSYSETDGTLPTGHNYTNEVITAPTCTTDGLRRSTCEICGDVFDTKITANGHNYTITESASSKGKVTRTYTCTVCGHSYKQELGDQYEEVTNYVEYLFEQYEPYMWWVLLATAGVWSVVMGVFFGIAAKNEDKEKARKMIKNYVIGLVVIAVILVACPYLVRGIAALIAG